MLQVNPKMGKENLNPDSVTREPSDENDENSNNNLPCFLSINPLTPEVYVDYYCIGDLEEKWRTKITADPQVFKGSWQLILGKRSQPLDKLLAAIGVGLLKRKLLESYAAITDIEVKSENDEIPHFKLTTYLPLKGTKVIDIKFDQEQTTQIDSDTGPWETKGVWLNGRAVQRRVSAKGIMFDTRAVFESDPETGPGRHDKQVMIFMWTFIPQGKPPITTIRWLKKL